MPPAFDIRDNSQHHRFEADLGDGDIAIAEYVLRDGTIAFTHTEVPRGHERQGIGTALIQAGLQSARQRGLKVDPICVFFAHYIAAHPQEQDLLTPSARDRLGL